MESMMKWYEKSFKQEEAMLVRQETTELVRKHIQEFVATMRTGNLIISRNGGIRRKTFFDLGITFTDNQDGESDLRTLYATAEGKLFQQSHYEQPKFIELNLPWYSLEWIIVDLKQKY